MRISHYSENVFINHPFDDNYAPLRNAMVFAIFDCGFRARGPQEYDDASLVRIETISKIIAECKYGIHDISRTALDPRNKLPRFNMPLELELFLGAEKFGQGRQRKKICLILDSSKYRYHKFISDISGQDTRPHHDNPQTLVGIVRNWFNTASGRNTIPGGQEIWRRYQLFREDLHEMCKGFKLHSKKLTFNPKLLWRKKHNALMFQVEGGKAGARF